MKKRIKRKKEKNKIESIIKKEINFVEREIYKVLISYVNPEFHDIVRYQIETGGKRLRPLLAIASFKMFSGKGEEIIYPSAGLEILHNYSLIIDDIIDNSPLRRGMPTVWVKFGESIAMCVSSYYAVSIFQSALKSKEKDEISNIFSKTLKIVMNGEILDILFEQKGKEEEPYVKKNRYLDIKEKDYLKMIGQKTAFFMASCCEIGGICANAKKEQIKRLKEYGFNLGMAFQISDDILDIFGKKGNFGKKIGKDIEDRKGGNCVIHFAMEEFSLSEKKEFLNILKKEEINKEDLKKAINMIKKTKAEERSINCGNYFAEKAKKSLSLLPQNKWNNYLLEKTDKIMKRKI